MFSTIEPTLTPEQALLKVNKLKQKIEKIQQECDHVWIEDKYAGNKYLKVYSCLCGKVKKKNPNDK